MFLEIVFLLSFVLGIKKCFSYSENLQVTDELITLIIAIVVINLKDTTYSIIISYQENNKDENSNQ